MALTAFVAHSFSDDDASHIAAFLEFLDSISRLNPIFTWKHARDAQPRDVREKVLDISGDADFFIAICSKKERVFDPSAARHGFLFPSKLVITGSDCHWVTSSWIIQEIGLAIGRNLPVILLLESGVRSPGGMQGNLEYIEFDRSVPGASFSRLSEMLGTFITDTETTDQQIGTVGEAIEVPNSDFASAPASNDEPGDTMSLAELRAGLWAAYVSGDLALARRYDSTFRASTYGASEEGRAEWESRNNWLSQVFTGASDLGLVASLAKKFPDNPEIGTAHARLLNQLGNAASSAAEFNRVANLGIDDADRIQRLCDSARVWFRSGASDVALSTLRTAISELRNDEDTRSRATIGAVLGDLLEEKDKFLKASLSEFLLLLGPSDREGRFQLAYLYGDIPMPAQAVHNYLRVPADARSDWGWNNLGVALGMLGAKGRAIAAYREAERRGSVLAISNRARILRDAGFLDEAEEAVLNSMRDGAKEPALAETLSSINSQRELETKIVDSRIEEAKKIERIARAFGCALLSPAEVNLNGKWQSEQFSITIETADNRLVGVGSFDQHGGLRRPATGILSGIDASKQTVSVKIRAEAVGSAAFGVIERSVEGSIASLMGGAAPKQVLVWFESAEGRLHLVERKSHNEFEESIFYKT